MTRVVVVGAGVGGVPMAYELKRVMGASARVVLVSDSPNFEFVPSNPWLAVGWRDPDDVSFPLRPYLARNGVEFVPQAAAGIDATAGAVVLAGGRRLDYDFLVLATGTREAWEKIPGLDPREGRAHSAMRSVNARAAHRAFQAFLDAPGPIVLGVAQHAANVGPAYELAFLIESDLAAREQRAGVPITILTAEPHPGHMGRGGSPEMRTLLESVLSAHDIRVICNARTDRVEAGRVHYTRVDESGRELAQESLPFAFSVYWPPLTGVGALAGAEGLVDERGFVRVDAFQRSPAHPRIYAVGTCVVRRAAPSPVPVGCPATVSDINAEVSAVAANIADAAAGREPSHRPTYGSTWLAEIPLGEDQPVPEAEPHHINWVSGNRWLHLAKIRFERHFIDRVRTGPQREPR